MTTTIVVRSLGPAPAPPAQTMYLHGAIITPTEFHANGTVVIAGQKIESVSATRIPGSDGTIEIDTEGLLCPGFVDTHNHAPYAAFARWKRPSRYLRGRFDWRQKTRCKVVVVPEPDEYYATNVSKPFKAITKNPTALPALTLFGQVRGVIGGATTMVIDADLDPRAPMGLPGFTRDPSDWPGRVWGILDVGCVDGDFLERIVGELTSDQAKLLVHVGEGVDEFSRGEFLSLDMKGLLTKNTALIHSMALLDSDWDRVKAAGASVIWSPRSNIRLYGRSIDIGQVLGASIRVALAPDWTITGSSTVLDELAFVRRRYSWILDERLLAMVTSDAADVMGMSSLGRIEPGALADILVFPRGDAKDRASAARAVVASSVIDIRAAIVGGQAVYGEEKLVRAFPDGGLATESIKVPVASGGSLDRVLRIGAGTPVASMMALLTSAFAAQGLQVAPLWEPD